MRPYLYAADLTVAPSAGDLGFGQLMETISCTVTREINGIYELEMQYPVTGELFGDIALRSLLYVNPTDTGSPQLFRVYKISKPLRGIVTINARHIAYDLAGYVCQPFTASGIQNAFSGIISNALPSGCPFTFSTSRTTAATFTVVTPCDIWSLMAGQQGSLLDVFTGEFDFDNFTVTMPTRLGADNGAEIAYGENMKDLKQDENCAEIYTAIYPYYWTEDDGLVQLDARTIAGPGTYPYEVIKAVDMTDRFSSMPTQYQLQLAAQAYLLANGVGVPKVSIDVDFVPLWQTLEADGYERASLLQAISLGDSVQVSFPALGVNATARAVSYKYNCLKDRYDKITIGSAQPDIGQVIQQMIDKSIS